MKTADLVRGAIFLAVWAGLITWAIVGSPIGDGLDGNRVLAWLRFDGDPALVSVFNGLGVWPLTFAAVLLADPKQRVPAWPFVLASFGIGAFALLPYLALRKWGGSVRTPMGVVRRWMTGRLWGGVLLASAVGLLVWGLGFGSADAFAAEWERSGLVTTMSGDFLVLTAVWWAVLVDDFRRRGGPAWALGLGLVPVIGAPVWLVVRPH